MYLIFRTGLIGRWPGFCGFSCYEIREYPHESGAARGGYQHIILAVR